MKEANKPKKSKIDTLIVSDIHLGGYSARCSELLDVLRLYDFQRLILNGDILNGLRFHRLNTAHWEVLSKLRKLSATCELIWVHGNHDAKPSILSNLLGINVCNHYIWKHRDVRFLAIHGHQFDKFLINNYFLSQIVFFLYNTIKRIDRYQIITSYIKDKSKKWKRSSKEVADKALQTARVLGVDYVFCGHTHKILSKEKYGIRYLNAGSWNEKPSGYITITDGLVELKKFD